MGGDLQGETGFCLARPGGYFTPAIPEADGRSPATILGDDNLTTQQRATPDGQRLRGNSSVPMGCLVTPVELRTRMDTVSVPSDTILALVDPAFVGVFQ